MGKAGTVKVASQLRLMAQIHRWIDTTVIDLSVIGQKFVRIIQRSLFRCHREISEILPACLRGLFPSKIERHHMSSRNVRRVWTMLQAHSPTPVASPRNAPRRFRDFSPSRTFVTERLRESPRTDSSGMAVNGRRRYPGRLKVEVGAAEGRGGES